VLGFRHNSYLLIREAKDGKRAVLKTTNQLLLLHGIPCENLNLFRDLHVDYTLAIPASSQKKRAARTIACQNLPVWGESEAPW
jgi:hypothetical protein